MKGLTLKVHHEVSRTGKSVVYEATGLANTYSLVKFDSVVSGVP